MKHFILCFLRRLFFFFLIPYFLFLLVFIFLSLGDVGVAVFNFSKSAILAYVIFCFIETSNVKKNQKFFYFCLLFSTVFLSTFTFERICCYLAEK